MTTARVQVNRIAPALEARNTPDDKDQKRNDKTHEELVTDFACADIHHRHDQPKDKVC
jgi:hypothetical protein